MLLLRSRLFFPSGPTLGPSASSISPSVSDVCVRADSGRDTRCKNCFQATESVLRERATARCATPENSSDEDSDQRGRLCYRIHYTHNRSTKASLRILDLHSLKKIYIFIYIYIYLAFCCQMVGSVCDSKRFFTPVKITHERNLTLLSSCICKTNRSYRYYKK